MWTPSPAADVVLKAKINFSGPKIKLSIMLHGMACSNLYFVGCLQQFGSISAASVEDIRITELQENLLMLCLPGIGLAFM